jgi:septum formation protein
LQQYSNDSIETIAGIVIYSRKIGESVEGFHVACSHFNEITDDKIDRIIARGDSLQCCGGFVIEDVDLNTCVKEINPGTMESVQGTHMPLVEHLLGSIRELEGKAVAAPVVA